MRLLSTLLRHSSARLGLFLLAGIAIAALIGPLFCADPQAWLAAPLEPPSWDHPLGTTGMGQDVLAQTLVGARPTLLVGLLTGALVVGLGALIGGTAGYLGGRADELLSLTINIFLVMPGLPLMVVLAAFLPPGLLTMTIVMVLTGWAWTARVLRAQVLSLRQRDYVSAAIVAGEPAHRILLIEIMPNMASLLASAWIGATLYAIGAQVGLEFLGLGDLNAVSWGTNLYWATNDAALLTGSWWTFLPTGCGVALTGFALTLVNFGLDEITSPRLAASAGGDGPPRATPVLHLGKESAGG
jgi:peptide/nickel transport system permease protein